MSTENYKNNNFIIHRERASQGGRKATSLSIMISDVEIFSATINPSSLTSSKEVIMPRFITMVFVFLLVLSSSAVAQWQFVRAYSPFKSPLKPANLWGSHGLAVDPEGKIWVAPFDATDTLTLGSATLLKRREIFVFHPNGTPASFSPIKVILEDSLNKDNSGRGISTDHQGNILYASFNRIFRINYKTGVGINKADPAHTASIGAAATDSAGNIYVSRVLGSANPVKIFGSDFSFIGNALDSTRNILRALAVSGDGTTIYLPNIYGGAANGIFVYRNALGPGFGIYSIVDTILKGTQPESINWQPRKGTKPILWFSAGSKENPPDGPYTESTWYGYNTVTKTIVDSLKWGATFPANPTFDDTVANVQRRRPRGIAFTTTGDTAYVTMFLADSNSVKMFVRGAAPVSVERDEAVVPSGYTLSQNYPNPFNPSTTIRFSITQTAQTTLKVYDVMGREVSLLVNESLTPGAYTSKFDGTNLPSGTYIYVLTSGGHRLTNKMVLLK